MWRSDGYGECIDGRGPQRNRWRKPTSEEILVVTGIVASMLLTIATTAGPLALFVALAAILVVVIGVDEALKAR